MGANTSPRFVESGLVSSASIATANTNLDGTGTLGTVVTATDDGDEIQLIRVQAVETTTAGMVRLFIDDGSSVRLYKEIPVTAITPSATQQAFAYEYVPTTRLILPSGSSLKASTENAEEFIVWVFGGSL